MSVFIDVNDFYGNGYSSAKITAKHSKVLSQLLEEEEWSKDQEKVFSALPSFFASKRTKDIEDGNSFYEFNKNRPEHISHFPQAYLDFIEGLFLDKMITGYWQEMYDLELRYLDLWDGAEDNPWHFEGSSDADIVFLLYMTDEAAWDKNWGGYLDLGIRKLSKSGIMSDFSDVEHIDTILPNNRTLVLMNNRKINTVHRSIALSEKKQRIVLTGEIKFHLKRGLDQQSKLFIPGLHQQMASFA